MAPAEEKKLVKRANKFINVLGRRLTEGNFSGERKKLKKVLKRAIEQLPDEELKDVLQKKLSKHMKTLEEKVSGTRQKTSKDEEPSAKAAKHKLDQDNGKTTKKKKLKKTEEDVAEHKFSYNLFLNGGALRKSELDNPGDVASACTLLAQSVDSMNDEEIDLLLSNITGKADDWLTKAQAMCRMIVGDNAALPLRQAMLYLNRVLAEEADSLLKLKSKRLRSIKDCLQNILLFFHYKNNRLEEKFSNPSYADLMAALLSVYADVIVVLTRQCEEEQRKLLTSHLLVMCSLLVPDDYFFDIILQQSAVQPSDAFVMIPVWRHATRSAANKTQCPVYTKHMMTVKHILSLLPADQRDEFLKAAMTSVPPPNYMTWLLNLDQSILDETPLTSDSPDGAITRYFVEEATDDFMENILNLLTNDSGTQEEEEAAKEPELPDAGGDEGEMPLYFMDKSADHTGADGNDANDMGMFFIDKGADSSKVLKEDKENSIPDDSDDDILSIGDSDKDGSDLESDDEEQVLTTLSKKGALLPKPHSEPKKEVNILNVDEEASGDSDDDDKGEEEKEEAMSIEDITKTKDTPNKHKQTEETSKKPKGDSGESGGSEEEGGEGGDSEEEGEDGDSEEEGEDGDSEEDSADEDKAQDEIPKAGENKEQEDELDHKTETTGPVDIAEGESEEELYECEDEETKDKIKSTSAAEKEEEAVEISDDSDEDSNEVEEKVISETEKLKEGEKASETPSKDKIVNMSKSPKPQNKVAEELISIDDSDDPDTAATAKVIVKSPTKDTNKSPAKIVSPVKPNTEAQPETVEISDGEDMQVQGDDIIITGSNKACTFDEGSTESDIEITDLSTVEFKGSCKKDEDRTANLNQSQDMHLYLDDSVSANSQESITDTTPLSPIKSPAHKKRLSNADKELKNVQGSTMKSAARRQNRELEDKAKTPKGTKPVGNSPTAFTKIKSITYSEVGPDTVVISTDESSQDTTTPVHTKSPKESKTKRRSIAKEEKGDKFDFTSDVETPAPLRPTNPRKITEKRMQGESGLLKSTLNKTVMDKLKEEQPLGRRRSRRLSEMSDSEATASPSAHPYKTRRSIAGSPATSPIGDKPRKDTPRPKRRSLASSIAVQEEIEKDSTKVMTTPRGKRRSLAPALLEQVQEIPTESNTPKSKRKSLAPKEPEETNFTPTKSKRKSLALIQPDNEGATPTPKSRRKSLAPAVPEKEAAEAGPKSGRKSLAPAELTSTPVESKATPKTKRRSLAPGSTLKEDDSPSKKVSPRTQLSAEKKKPLTRRRSTLITQLSTPK